MEAALQSPEPELEPAATDRRLAAFSGQRRALYEALRAEGQRTREAGPLELLRPGTGDPVILVHPIGGQVYGYADLIRELTTVRPVQAIAADRVLGGSTPPAFETLAAHYLDRIAEAGIRPAVFAGWSFGGVLAYQIAPQAAGRGTVCPPLPLDSRP